MTAGGVRWICYQVARHDQYRYVGYDEGGGGGDKVGNDKAGGVGGNSVASTRVSSVLTNACSDPRTAVDYCLRFYLNPDRWFAMNRLRTSGSGDTTHALQ
ncbi:uncharacterized protein UHOD_12248 [Ustilago sp. UG-2017b]|nr:uncharacterized protein UHOD_12248 [Ustilago sp. UG-2017b]